MKRDGKDNGFTLVEILVVVVILATLYQVIAGNIGQFIPQASLDRAASELTSQLDLTRSDSRINSRSYQLQLDVTNSRWRWIYPPEERRSSDEFVSDDEEDFALNWQEFPDGVQLQGVVATGRDTIRNGLYSVVFDENGFTADHAFFFGLEDNDNYAWTVQYLGLTGVSEVIANEQGEHFFFDEVTEGDF